MREIKFRGKCIKSGEFVYGDLIHGVGPKSGRIYILPKTINLAYVKHCDPLDGVEVNPETVGQFTGLRDKTRKTEIYDGDTLKDHAGYKWRVFWFEDNACFGVKSLDNNVVSEIIDNVNLTVINESPELL